MQLRQYFSEIYIINGGRKEKALTTKDYKLYSKECCLFLVVIRKNSKTGMPCGDKGFIQKIEGVLGRKLNALPKGRPRRRE